VHDTRALAAALVRRGWSDWDESLLAVTDVVGARSGLVLTAADGASAAEHRVQAGALPAEPALADLSAATAVGWRRHIGLEWLAADVTPFYRVVRLRKGWFRKVKKDYGPRQRGRGAADVPVPPVLLEEAQDDPAAVLEQVPADEQPLSGEATR
jgi:hypothetical protein